MRTATRTATRTREDNPHDAGGAAITLEHLGKRFGIFKPVASRSAAGHGFRELRGATGLRSEAERFRTRGSGVVEISGRIEG